MAVAVVTITESTWKLGVRRLKVAWLTNDSTGAASEDTVYEYTGQLVRLITVPSGVNVPTTLYDITANDDDGVDALMGAGLNRSATATEQVLGTSLGVVFDSKLTFAVTNAGNATRGIIYLYITPYRNF